VTSGIAIGLGLAIAASLALGTGFLLQHAGAAEAPPVDPREPVATLVGLLRQRIWLAGLAPRRRATAPFRMPGSRCFSPAAP
jgi:hypothetical protein